jgi:hypothetical protein
MRKKRWTNAKAAPPRKKMIRDSFQLPRALRTKMLKASKDAGVSKSALLRWACEIVLLAVKARLDGKDSITIELGGEE